MDNIQPLCTSGMGDNTPLALTSPLPPLNRCAIHFTLHQLLDNITIC